MIPKIAAAGRGSGRRSRGRHMVLWRIDVDSLSLGGDDPLFPCQPLLRYRCDSDIVHLTREWTSLVQ